ncbi:MAG: TetR/AcrR family transcriptional regulator [Actinomycetota bacterium]
MSSVTPDAAAAPPLTRRERLRAELTAEIKAVARRQLDEGGPSAVSWRGIARAVGMSPASLYTYFESLDDLYTSLIAESYSGHAAALQRAVDAMAGRPLPDRLFASMIGYREWGVRRPGEFRLLYNNPIPEYQAPEDGPTTDATLAVGAVFLTLLQEGWRSGEIDPAPPGPPVDTDKIYEAYGIEITSDEFRTAIGAWGTIHGLTSLEVHNNLSDDWIDAPAVFLAEMRTLSRSWGLADAGDDVAALAATAAAASDDDR